MKNVRLRLGIALLVTGCASALQPLSLAQAQSDPARQANLQAGRDALASRQWLKSHRFLQRGKRGSQGPCSECYLGIAAAYGGNGQLQDAIDNCDKALQIATDNESKATAHSIKGKALVELAVKEREKLAQAESESRAAAQIEARNPLFHLLAGDGAPARIQK
jgi:tetratricopeptide (TPR) repeat protein